MKDGESVVTAQRAFWNSEATRRWVTEHARINRFMTKVTEAALAAAAPTPGESVLDIGCGTGTINPEHGRGCWAERVGAWRRYFRAAVGTGSPARCRCRRDPCAACAAR
jgi:hypothetical protein